MVEFMGMRLIVPYGTKWVAADCVGVVWALTSLTTSRFEGYWNGENTKIVGNLCREVPEWRDTPKEVTRDR
jgi:hypothetical protein